MNRVKRWLSGAMGVASNLATERHERSSRRSRRSPGALAEAARYAPELRSGALFESLENRQYLFQIVIPATPQDPLFTDPFTNNSNITPAFDAQGNYVGVEVVFAYVMPLFNLDVIPPQPAAANVDNTSFIDEQPAVFFPDPATGIVQINDRFSFVGVNAQVEIAQLPIVPPATDAESRLRLTMDATGGQATAVFFTPVESPAPDVDPRIYEFKAYQAWAMIITAANGFNPGDLHVEVLQVPYFQTINFLQDVTANTSADGQNLVNSTQDPTLGGQTLIIAADPNNGPDYFNAVRFVLDQGTATIDFSQIFSQEKVSRWGPTHDAHLFSAKLRFMGPVGSVIEVLDLYGRQMQTNLALSSTAGNPMALVDLEDDGIPDFNDGIGRISMTGTNATSRFTITGGTADVDQDDSDGDGFFGDFVYLHNDSITGQFNDFEAARFGFRTDINGDVVGLPLGGGSVIIGAPFFRDNTADFATYYGNRQVVDPANAAPLSGFQNFSNTPLQNNLLGLPGIPVIKQGVSADNNIGTILVHGMTFGVVDVSGSVDVMNIGTLMGSINIGGDARAIFIGSDAGTWLNNEETATITDQTIRTGSTVTVGRTLGQYQTGGRNYARVTVLSDINNSQRPPIQFLNHGELEAVASFNAIPQDFTPDSFLLEGGAGVPDLLTGQGGFIVGDSVFRNDSILSAEFVGAGLRGARISGTVGAFNLYSTTEDTSDFYAFSAARGDKITFDVVPGGAPVYARVVDRLGRVIAAAQYPPLAPSGNQTNVGNPNVRFRFTADRSDTYYLVVGIQPDGNFGSTTGYTVTMSGQQAVAAGAITSGANTRATDITVRNGSLGLVRGGTGISPKVGGANGGQTGGGAVATAADLGTSTIEDNLDFTSIGGLVVNVANGSLFSFIAGGDIRALALNIGGNLGSFSAGELSRDDNGGYTFGDITGLALRVGGSIGRIEAPLGLGFQNNGTGQRAAGPAGQISISSGTAGGPGHIGAILVGNTFIGNNFTLTTSADSVVGQFIVGTRGGGAGVIGQFQPNLQLGPRSDIRFANFDRVVVGSIGSSPDVNLIRDINYGQTLRLVDDNGTPFTIRIGGGIDSTAAPNASRVRVRFLPVNGSQGVVVARIEAALVNGADLVIQGETAGVVSIGEIRYATDGGTAVAKPDFSTITFTGPAEIDVLSIVTDAAVGGNLNVQGATGGILGGLRNQTVRGDIVAADIAAIAGGATVFVTGNLGLTQTFGVGDRLIGPFLGLSPTANTTVGGAMGFLGASNTQAAQVQIGLFQIVQGLDPKTMEDVGAPFDGYLNGLVIRNGNGRTTPTNQPDEGFSVRVNGSIGDVIAQNTASVLTNLVANADNTRVLGAFDGIVGSIYANDMGTVDVGDGIAAPGDSPFAIAGVFAADDIARFIAGTRVKNPTINGVVIASDINTAATGDQGAQGLASVQITTATVDGAFFGSTTTDSWWRSFRYITAPPFPTTEPGDPIQATGVVNRVQLTGTTLRRSTIVGTNVNQVTITRGVFDASTIQAQLIAGQNTGNIGTIRADGFINSTRDGEALEYRIALIRAAGDIDTIQANTRGSISDLFIDVNGNINKSITALNMVRLSLDVDATIAALRAQQDFRSINVTAGRVLAASAQNIRSSTFTVAGELRQISATNNIVNSTFVVNGGDGQIGSITAGNSITGEITSSGVVRAITATRGDISALVRTTQPDADLLAIKAGRDAAISLDALGNVGTVTAARHVGRRAISGVPADTFQIRGNLGSIVAGGQVYADVKVGKDITGTITAGRVAALPDTVSAPSRDRVSAANIIAYGRIAAVTITGDFAGRIESFSGGIGKVSIVNGSLRRYDPTIGAVTPGAPVGGVFAHDGNIDSLTITRGHLLGDVIADNGSIGTISIKGDANFGDIGIDPTKVIDPNLPTAADTALANSEGRYRLPGLPTGATGAGRDGPTIQARFDIGTISTTGRLFEAAIIAGRSIKQVAALGADDVGGTSLTPSFILAGDLVTAVSITGNVDGLLVGAGLTRLGADGLPGGVGGDADTVESGDVGTVAIKGTANNLRVTAGMNAGADGFYNTADDLAAVGTSTVKSVTVTGAASGSVYADTSTGVISGGLIAGGVGLGTTAPVFVVVGLPPGTPIPAAGQHFTINGSGVTIKPSGAGQVFFDDVTLPGVVRLLLIDTQSNSSLQIVPDVGVTSLTNLQILSTDDASLSSLSIPVGITGAFSGMYVDGTVGNATFGNISTTPGAPGLFRVGQSINTLVVGAAGNTVPNIVSVQTQFLGTATFNGGLGDTASAGAISNASRLDAKSITALTLNGSLGGVVSVDADAARIAITGAVDEAGVRVGGATQQFSAASLFRARLAFRNGAATVNITGGSDESFIYAGTDLGADARLAGVGANADSTGNGNFGTVRVGGDFTRSDLAAGVRRADTGFLTTPTDVAAPGHSTITNFAIVGTQVGSLVGSQAYGIVTNGTLGTLTIGGSSFTGQQGNFSALSYINQPELLRVTDLRVVEVGGVFTAKITFSQAVNQATLSSALFINEVRGAAGNLSESDALVENTDYFLSYDADTFVLSIEFSTAITSRHLTNDVPGLDTPQVDINLNPLPSPGIYRFTLLSDFLRGQDTGQLLDGNADGNTDDDFRGYTVVGDAGDKLDTFTANTDQANIPFYAPVNLDVLMGAADSGLKSLNSTATIRGKIGDHPLHDTATFPVIADLDVYTITLRAGQILRFDGLVGPASGAEFRFFRLDTAGGGTPLVAGDGFQRLPIVQPTDPAQGVAFSWLIQQAGTYGIAISTGDGTARVVDDGFYNPFPPSPNTAFFAPDANNIPAISRSDIVIPTANPATAVGDYSFGIRVSDDGDNGFAAIADPADGLPVSVPVPADFATPTSSISIADFNGGADFVYTLRIGSDGVANTADDYVVGTNGRGINSTRDAGLDGLWGTADDRVLLTNDAGDGLDMVSVPVPQDFAGPDGTLRTFDDLIEISRDGYVYTLNAGLNGLIDGNIKSDDLVVGTDVYGNRLTRTAGRDANFNTLDDLNTVGGSIGDSGVSGYTPIQRGDLDVINLNAGGRLPVNTRLRLTLRTVEEGRNLGLVEPSRSGWQGEVTANDLRGLVQMAIFDTSAKSDIGDGRLIAAPDRINYLDGTPNLTLANDGFTKYGFDEKGDFYIEFTVPPRLDNNTVSASLSVYIQGVVQTNYELEVQDLGVGPAPVVKTQNILLETNGGTVNWLEANSKTTLAAFDALTNGFTSRFNGVTPADYILNSPANPNNLVAQVQAFFDTALGAGRVRISTNPADFEGQVFSTIFITSTPEPAPFFSKGNFGEVQRVDPFNANAADEGVVFTNALNLLGSGPGQNGADAFTRSLAAAVARQAAQLMGVRVTAAVGAPIAPVEIMADDSPNQDAGPGSYTFTNTFNNLAGQGAANSNTQFFLGQQSSFDLLRRIFGVA